MAATIAFIAPWFAFVKQMKLRWRGVFPHLESDFQPGLLCGAFLILQLLNLNSRQFNQLVARTDSRPTWKQLDAMVNASLSRCGAQDKHFPSTDVFPNFFEILKFNFFAIFCWKWQLCFACHFLTTKLRTMRFAPFDWKFEEVSKDHQFSYDRWNNMSHNACRYTY